MHSNAEKEDLLQIIDRIDNYILNKDFESAFILMLFLLSRCEDTDKEFIILYYKRMFINMAREL
jgi:hypothetical protein